MLTETTLIVCVFAAVFAGMAFGRVPRLRTERSGIAFIGAALLIVANGLGLDQAVDFIDLPTVLLLFGLMVLSAQFEVAGFYRLCAARIASVSGSPAVLLAAVVGIAGGLSAVLANDIVVFAMTPLLCQGLLARGLDPRPYLIALACASNAGSAATLIGNPQNVFIGQAGELAFGAFLAACAAPALLALVLVYLGVWLTWRRALGEVGAATQELAVEPLDRAEFYKALAATALLLALFMTGLRHEAIALVVVAALLLSRRIRTRTLLQRVDWPLLVLFGGLFVVTGSFAGTGLGQAAIAWLRGSGLEIAAPEVLASLSLVASNTIGNVPAVLLLLSVWEAPGPESLYALAVFSTLSGNLLLTGSLANIIVAERAASQGVSLGFLDFARSGLPITLASLLCAWAWFALL
ncbi:MAG: SLC13 family permease [Rhodovibrionaceae bacterium]